MPLLRVFALTTLAMVAFAGNSLLCRLALQHTAIDPASFTTIRLATGAVVLWLLVRLSRRNATGAGNVWSAVALLAYALAFSYAYVSLSAGTGALLLFGAVQVTMIGHGLWSGERLRSAQGVGLVLALGGLVAVVLPGVSAPPWQGAALMLLAGVAWGVYSLRGKGAGDPTRVTAGNFLRAAPMALLVSFLTARDLSVDSAGAAYAVASGAIASGLGYAVWYTALPLLRSTSAAVVQLSVPVLAALAGVALLAEPLSLRLVLAGFAVLGGIALVVLGKSRVRP